MPKSNLSTSRTEKDNANSLSLEDSGPMMVCRVEDKKLGFQGILAIDSLFKGSCAGGVRMTPDVTENDVILLSRTMTLKFGFLNIPMGGAKAGIRIRPSCTEQERMEILQLFGKKLKPLIQKGIYFPGEDMGTYPSDIQLIKKAAGLRQNSDDLDGHEESGYYTGLTAVTAAKTMAQFAGMEISQCSIGIEGFGKVGQGIAEELSREKARVVGVSTKLGGIYQPSGLEVQDLLSRGATMGDALIENVPQAEKIKVEDLITSEVDILFLCGKPRAITLKNAGRIKAKIIIGAGNLCFEDGVEPILYRKGIYHLPDFVTSCGGVLALTFKEMGLKRENIERVIREEYSQTIQRLLRLSKDTGRNPSEVAREIAQRNFQRMKTGEPQDKMHKRICNLLQKAGSNGWTYVLACIIRHIPILKQHMFQHLVVTYARGFMRSNRLEYQKHFPAS